MVGESSETKEFSHEIVIENTHPFRCYGPDGLWKK